MRESTGLNEKEMKFSYWEHQAWLANIDFTIVGSGITGLSCALHLKQRFPTSRILILERGLLPNGASTKNAGFACFGSLSEILDDLNSHTHKEVLELVEKRINGLKLLRTILGDDAIDYQQHGGYEVFLKDDKAFFEKCLSQRRRVNELLSPIVGEDVFEVRGNQFGFNNIQESYLYNRFEGQINTGKMMEALLKKVQCEGINVLNNTTVESFDEGGGSVAVKTDHFEFRTGHLLIATNGFASQLGIPEVKPARSQVLITKPIADLKIKGTFHLDRGYYYFRNIQDRILLGGGRNLDPQTEQTTLLGETRLIQNRLDHLLESNILPDISYEVDRRWSGIMGVGIKKKAVVEQVSEHVFCGVRLGGMGVAIGSLIGKDLASLP